MIKNFPTNFPTKLINEIWEQDAITTTLGQETGAVRQVENTLPRFSKPIFWGVKLKVGRP